MSDETAIGPDVVGDYPEEVLAEPDTEPSYAPGEVAEIGDPDDDGHGANSEDGDQ